METPDYKNFISINDYIGKIENGLAIDLSIMIQDDIYHIMYWFDKNDNYKLSAEQKFLDKYNLSSIYEYSNVKKLAYYIHTFVIKNKDELLTTFNIT